ncbi:MAG: response regulator transcription factor [Bryobacterales bacterium]
MESAPDITVLLADDHQRVREHVRFLLEPEFAVVGAVADGSALVATALELKPRVVVTDFMMEPTNGIEAAAAILAHCVPKPAIVMLTAVSDPETARAAFAAGILGFVSKMHLSEDLIPAIEAALAGLRFLSQLPPAA